MKKLLLTLLWLPLAAFAQAYPAKPVKLLVGFAAGGLTNVIARIVAQDFRAWLAKDLERWERVIKAAGVKPE